MIRPRLTLFWLWFYILVVASPLPSRCSDEGDHFTSLFNGKSFEGWQGKTQNYKVVDGTIQCKEDRGGTLYTVASYSDFILKIEFKLPSGGNNGLAIRYPGEGDPAYAGMCEIQILDNSAQKYATLDDRQYHGSAYGLVAAKRGYLKPVGNWNSQTVTVTGHRIKVELNGTTILDADLSEVNDFFQNKPHPGKDRLSGHIGFAGHKSPVAFRNIYIQEL